MTEFDVNELLFSFEAEMSDIGDQVMAWLDDNVGETVEREGEGKISLFDPEPYKGKGWRIVSRNEKHNDGTTETGMNIISWHLQIEDEQKAMMFALKWGAWL